MNYKRVYDSLVKKAITSHREKGKGVYYEQHHIIPRCLGGTDKESNLILLTAKEHYIAHLLLYHIHKKSKYHYKLAFALWSMRPKFSNTKKRYRPSSRGYKMMKEAISAALSKKNKGREGTFKGKTHTEATKQKIREKQLTIPLEVRKRRYKGHLHTKENIAKAAQAKCKAVKNIDKTSNYFNKSFSSAKQACEKTGVSIDIIGDHCRGNRKTTKWVFI